MSRSKSMAFLLIGFTMVGSISWAAKRQGAQVVITAKSGSETRGELLAVKRDFLVVSSPSSGEVNDLSLPIADIHEVKIVKRSQAGKGALIGLLVGAAGGAWVSFLGGDDKGGMINASADEKALMGGGVFGLLGAAVGGIIGSAAGADTSFVFDRQPTRDQQERLGRLRRSARLPGIQ